jgi:hypothetical protein
MMTRQMKMTTLKIQMTKMRVSSLLKSITAIIIYAAREAKGFCASA